MAHLDFAQARFNMVEQQVRPWEVLDQKVLDLMLEVPREHFVPDAYQGLAYADTGIPLGQGEVMLPPRLVGRILQALDVRIKDTVLEIGTGSGYLTALLAKSAQHVRSVERIAAFSAAASGKLAALGIDNVSLETGDGLQGWPQYAPYDVIVVTASLPVLPPVFQEQLSIGGRLFVIVGEAPAMQACLLTRTHLQEWRAESLFETEVPPLRGAPRPPQFVF